MVEVLPACELAEIKRVMREAARQYHEHRAIQADMEQNFEPPAELADVRRFAAKWDELLVVAVFRYLRGL